MAEEFDLLGDPIPEGFGRRGRPPHRVTDEKRRVVMMLCAFGRSIEFIAAALSITPPTLRKNYFRELRAKEEARARLDGKLLAALMKQIEDGNISAAALMFKRLDKLDLQHVSDAVTQRGSGPRAAAKKGKKEQLKEAAGQVGGRFAPRPSPRLIN